MKGYELFEPTTPRIVGLETEYSAHRRSEPEALGITHQKFDESAQRLDPTQVKSFGEWGGRIYLDINSKIEVATPESLSVRGLLAAHLAGERMAHAIAQDAFQGDVSLYKRSVDHRMNSAADHENYYLALPQLRTMEIAHKLAAHLASRVVITGPGMLRPNRYNDGFDFTIDQRASVTNQADGSLTAPGATQPGKKPFVLSREEHFDNTNKSRRLQVVSGSQNMYPFPIAARFLMTSAVVRMIEYGAYPDSLVYTDPYRAIHVAGGKAGLTERSPMINNRSYSAPEVQMRLAEALFDFHETHGLPAEELAITRRCYEIAQDLAKDNFSQWNDHVEWLGKKQLLDRHGEKLKSTTYDNRSARLDLLWHEVAQESLTSRMRDNNLVAFLPSEEDINQASRRPLDQTRALRRSNIIRLAAENNTPLTHVNWHEYRYDDSKSTSQMSDAYDHGTR